MTAPICFADTETDGVHPTRQPWEIAFIRREPDGTEGEYAAFVEIDLSTADPFGLKVGGFYDRHPVGRFLSGKVNQEPEWDDRLEQLGGGWFISRVEAAIQTARWTHGAHVVGAIPSFDTATLEPLLRAHKISPAWHYHIIDVEAQAVGFLAGRAHELELAGRHNEAAELRVHPPYKSDDLAFALGLPPVAEDARHTALGDARYARAIYDRIMEPARALVHA